MDLKTKYKAKKIKAVFFDIDDTLRIKDTGYMPESIKLVFNSLKTQGIITGIASGRAIYGVVPEIKALEPDYFVTINGSYVETGKGKEIFKNPIPKELVEGFVNWCHSVGIDYGFVGSQKAVVSKRTTLIDDAIVPVYGELDVAPDFYHTNDIYQMWTFEEVGDSLTLPENLSKELRLVRWHKHSSDVVRKGISKASGLAKVLETSGLKPENVLVFGDEKNDIEIFDYAGLTIAMGNAIDEIKEKADYITGTVEEDGIINALEELGMVEKELHFPQLDVKKSEGPVAIIKTNLGDLKLKLFPKHAPKTVANFIALSKDGYYDGVIFHRVINDFMIQGGDPTGTGMGGESIYGERFEDEFSKELYNLRGALSMANAGPNTNGSQFFIVQNKTLPYSPKEMVRGGWPEEIAKRYTEGGTPHLDNRHTVFGQLLEEESYKVLDEIASVETGFADKPVQDVTILTIEVID
ncbi:bifunctional Cof-type HAD-IIB family hydrolase/peptidylprolyl isomerase [Streptococcus pacificus]|uniref:peptidylprolyl isomerase n=1 Tax=Streptococcus pacificus TaxID=2740577 RepID=A0ABS0ZIY9_9STRE|nr:Cof-type HAD-IIB family hydrolase [Streptococcus pacificus]MBJ8325683.1 Cof-type HAD-IIB family hydrolase [Streptococcus pacificus]